VFLSVSFKLKVYKNYMITKESTKLFVRDWSQALVSNMDLSSKQAKHVQGNGNMKNATFKKAINISSIKLYHDKDILLKAYNKCTYEQKEHI